MLLFSFAYTKGNVMKYRNIVVPTLSALGLLFGAVGAAQAVEFGNHAWGPIELNGYITVDNTPNGGSVENFACKVVGYGRIDPWFPDYAGFPPTSTNVMWIEGVQARHRSSGDEPGGCNMVRFFNLPWAVTVTGTDTNPSITIDDVGILAPQSVGCGDVSGTGGVTVGSTGIAWAQEGAHVPAGVPQTDAVYSTLTFTNAAIPSSDGNCIMNGIIKITRPHAPYLVP